MTVVTAFSETAVQADEDTSPSAAPKDISDADLLQGLGALADLINDASETLNQCIVTIESKLSALPVTKEEWIPIKTARSAVERIAPPCEEQTSQERVFDGVSVTIMRFGALAAQPERTQRCEWQYELGYSATGADWALMIRAASFDRSTGGGASTEFSDLMALRDAPLEIKLKAIREIPDLIQRLDGGPPDGFDAVALEPPPDPQVDQVEDVIHRAAS